MLVAFVAFAASAQPLKTLTTLQLNGAVTNYFTAIPVTGAYKTLSIQVKCTQTGGTSDGYMLILASNDNVNYVTLNNILGKMVWGSPKSRMTDSITGALSIYNGATLNWVIKEPAHRYYKIQATGTSGDSTSLAGNYVLK